MYQLHNKKKDKERRRTLRKDATKAEQALWKRLHSSQIDGHKFRRQHGIGKYIVDFCCSSIRLIVEVDGYIHGEQENYDVSRQTFLESKGYTVLRVRNDQVLHDVESVVQKIYTLCNQLSSLRESNPT